MKIVNRFILTAFLMLPGAFLSLAQESIGWKYQLPKECWESMVSGKPQEVAKYFAPSVELSLPSGSGLYSSKQATVVLQEFLAKNSISHADIDHERQTGKSTMMIATVEIAGRPFRVYVLTQQGQNGLQIQKLRVEEEK